MHLSAWTDKWVDPSNIDEDLFYQLLQEKIKTSKFKKETIASPYRGPSPEGPFYVIRPTGFSKSLLSFLVSSPCIHIHPIL